MLQEFRAFIQKGNVLDLAVAVIMGAAFGAIVNSLVADIITPDYHAGDPQSSHERNGGRALGRSRL